MLEQKQVKGNERLMVVTSVFIGSLLVRNMEKHKFSSWLSIFWTYSSLSGVLSDYSMFPSFYIPELSPFVQHAFKNWCKCIENEQLSP